MFDAVRGLTALFRHAGGGFGATCMVYSDDTPVLIKALAWASKAIYGDRVQICDGTTDEVEINAALTAIAAIGGKVVLSEGTFHIADPVVIPGNNIVLQGLGPGTIIDGDLLATTEHAIVISGVTDCVVKELAVQTEDGGGKTCHCIFIEDGANGTRIQEVRILDSDADGIHIEGTTMYDVSILHCHIDDTDGHGIYAHMDDNNSLYRSLVRDNLILSAGMNGISFEDVDTGGYYYCILDDNIVFGAIADGMSFYDLFSSDVTNNEVLACGSDGIYVNSGEYDEIRANVVDGCTDEGIFLVTVPETTVSDNICTGNGDTGDHAGIKVNPDSPSCLVEGNHCIGNSYYGIFNYAPYTEVVANYVHENARHGIVMQGHEGICSENYVYDNGQESAGTYHGIYATNNCYQSSFVGNYCDSPGDSQEDGIHMAGTNSYCSLVGNWCSNGMGSGIYISGATSFQAHANYCYDNDDYGIELTGCSGVHVKDNMLVGNDTAEYLENACTNIATPEIWAPFAFEDVTKGYRPVVTWTNNADTSAYCTLQIPLDFQQFVSAVAVVIPGANGNLVWLANTSFGKICTDEQENAHTDTVAQNTVGVTNNELECLDLAAAFDALDLGDNVGVQVARIGTSGDDTSEADAYAVGVRLRYV